MKIRTFFATLTVAAIASLLAPQADACTGLIVGKGASKDGSVMISYAADSHTIYG